MMSGCYDCGLDYEDDGWIEAIIPDQIWNEISPTNDHGGLLCITCISRRLVKKGYKTAQIPVELSGVEPLRNITENERYERLENKYGKLVDHYELLYDQINNKDKT